MTNGSLVRVNFVVVTSWEALVTKEVNILKALGLYMAQAVGLIPARWELEQSTVWVSFSAQLKILATYDIK